MTRDLAVLIRADQPWLTTSQFLDKLDEQPAEGDALRLAGLSRSMLSDAGAPVME